MRTLALETSSDAGSIAALEDGRLCREVLLDPQRRTAESLAPALQSLLEQLAWRPDSVQRVAVSQGPGSFTGLRVGVTTAKCFAYATGAAAIGIPTLEVIAAQAVQEGERLWTVLDARRGQLFAAPFVRASQGWQAEGPAQILDASAWLAQLTEGCRVSGAGLSRLTSPCPAFVQVEAADRWTPRAATVGRLADRAPAASDDDLWSLTPLYLRRSYAER